MKILIQLGLCGLLAPGLFAARQAAGGANRGHAGSITSGTHARRTQGSMRTPAGYGYGRYGRGYGGLYWGDYEPFSNYGDSQPEGPGESAVDPVAQHPLPQTAHPVIHEYGQGAEEYGIPGEPASNPALVLIAFRDKTIRAATTYWVAGGALHYLDTDQQEKQAPLTSVDRDLSLQLNSERHVPFNIQ
jgi:hypothetical protein